MKFSKVLIHGTDVTDRIESISESNYGYRVCFTDGAASFNKADVSIFEVDTSKFNITQYKWSDDDMSFNGANEFNVEFTMRSDIACISKKDTIALAKHFKLTSEDLK